MIQVLFYICSLPAICGLLLVGAVDLIIQYFQTNFTIIVFDNVKKEPIFIFLIALMFAISVFFVLYRITAIKLQAASPKASSKLRKTFNNFCTSIIYMLIFPTAFFLGITAINSISKLIQIFLFKGQEQNWATIFLKMGIVKEKWFVSGGIFGVGFWINKKDIILQGNFSEINDQLMDYFWNNSILNFGNYNPLFGGYAALAGLAIFAQLLYYLIGNFFQLMLGFLYSPFPIFKRVYDDGITFKSWKNTIIRKMQTVIIINLLLSFIIFILNFIHENKLNLDKSLAFVFELVATGFLVLYLRKFYCKIVQFIELKTENDFINEKFQNKKKKWWNKYKGGK